MRIPTPSLTERDLAVLWHPGSQMRDYRGPGGFPPLEVVGAEGSCLHLADGRIVLDAISSWWCKSLGHRHPRLRAAMLEQADHFEHVILANTTHEPIVRLCERLCAMANAEPISGFDTPESDPQPLNPKPQTPTHFSKTFFADNGSTAVEIAMKMALQAQAQRDQPRRTGFAALVNGYHGETAGALSISDCDLYRRHYGPMMFPVTKIGGLPYRSGPDDPRWMDAADEWPAIEAQLDTAADTLAAIVYEPVLQGAGNMRLYSPDLLPRLRAWADARGVYLIADEIAAGFGRLGPMLASHLPGRQSPRIALRGLPDFAVISKGLTAGYLPLSAVLTTDAVYDLFDADYVQMKAFLHSNTYTGHALAVAVANAVLDVFAEEDIPGQVAIHGPRLREGLAELAATRPYIRGVRGCGMMAAADLCRPDGSPLDWKRRTGYRVYRRAVAHLTRPALLRPIGDTMYLFPPLNTPQGDLDAMLATLADSLDAVFA